MKLGYSMLLQEYLKAEEVDYGDCADFQIVCPCCHDALFKSGNDETKRQFLSHYRASRSDIPDCELRVGSIDNGFVADFNSVSRGQQLKIFQDVFRKTLLNDYLIGGERRNEVIGYVNNIIDRKSFHKLIDYTRSAFKTNSDKIWSIQQGTFSNYSKFWVDRQLGFAKDFSKHLLRKDSEENLRLCVAVGILHICDSLGGRIITVDRKNVLEALRGASDNQLRKHMYRSERDMGQLLGTTAEAMGFILMQFPYMEVLKQGLNKNNAPPKDLSGKKDSSNEEATTDADETDEEEDCCLGRMA